MCLCNNVILGGTFLVKCETCSEKIIHMFFRRDGKTFIWTIICVSGYKIYVIDILYYTYLFIFSQKEEPKPTTTAASVRPAGPGTAVKVLLVIATVWLIIAVAVMVAKIIIS